MDERKRRMLGAFLNGFLLTDIKRIITLLNEHLLIKLSKTQRKAILISMIVDQVNLNLANNDNRILDILVGIMNQMKSGPTFERVDDYIDIIGSSNVVRSRPDPMSFSGTSSTTAVAPRIGLTSSFQYHVTYKASPFYLIHSRLGQAKLCTSSVNTRASRYFTFEMTPEQLRYFDDRYTEDGKPMYEIRFFCTSYDAHTASRPKDIEFPAICEIKVNADHVINGNAVRGMKNKPGTANPADLTPSCHISSRRNAIEFVYAHTAKPYIGSVELVKRFPVTEIVKKLKSTSTISKEETLQRMHEREADTDIVLESETISTKCPLGFCRIQTPSRSKHCQHLQCFDATTFLLMNQQTPTWCCPICNRKMESWDEVGVDEYFQDILAQVSDKVDTIRIEEGGKFKVLDSDDPDMDDDDGEQIEGSHSNNTNKRSLDNHENPIVDPVTILDDDGDLDDDTDDIPLSKRHKMDSTQHSSEPPTSTDNDQVIDLTLDSDDDIEMTINDRNVNDFFSDSDDEENSTPGSDESNAQNLLPNSSTTTSSHTPVPTSTTTTTTSSAAATAAAAVIPSPLPLPSASTEQSGSFSAIQPTTTTVTSPSTAPIGSASPTTTMTANSTLSPTTPPRNLIKLPWPPISRSQPPIASSSLTENSTTIHLPAQTYPTQPTPSDQDDHIYHTSSSLPQSPRSTLLPAPLVNDTPMNRFIHK